MEILKTEITIRELTDGYRDNDEEGVIGFKGDLDIRPPYQREFVYNTKQRDLVIDTVIKGFPLNIMYWNTKDDGKFEVLDGQQRTISICEYVVNNFSFEKKIFDRQPDDIQERIFDYKLDIYQCKGEASERIKWFEIINVAGEVLKKQELLNAIYAGTWTAEAKKKFSKSNCPAKQIAEDYMTGSPIRQDYLETVLKWTSPNGDIAEFMNQHAKDKNADELWLYFQNVINWVKVVFPAYRKEMKDVAWGLLYNNHKNQKFDAEKLEVRVSELMADEDVESKKGIYTYVLTGKEKHLNIRAFSLKQKSETYEKQKGICAICNEHFKKDEMEADHITPWHEGGKTNADNCQMLCKEDNRRKSGK